MTVAMEYTPRLTALRVVEFVGNDQPLRTTDLPLSEDMPAGTAGPDAGWRAVEGEGGVNLLLTVEGSGLVTERGGYMLNRVYDLGINSARTYQTKYAEFTGTVMAIN